MVIRPLLPPGQLAAFLMVLFAALGPEEGSAQQSVIDGLELWAGTGAWATGPGHELPVGVRFGVAAFGASSPRRHFALELVYGRYTPDGTRRLVSEFGVAVAARWALAERDRTHPFLQIRSGLGRRKGSATRSDPTQDAFVLGPEVGVVVPVSERLELLAGVDATWHWSADVRQDTGVVSDTGGHGLRWGLRIGLTLRTALDTGVDARGGPR